MKEEFSRTAMLLGSDTIETLEQKKVAIFGVGGVGGYVCEALVRSGVGHFLLVDSDQVARSNLNRQIIATQDTIGRDKVDVMKERMLSINPQVDVEVRKCFFLPENQEEFPFEEYDYVVDAVDTVTAKVALIMRAKEYGVPIISSMGAGNKLDPSRFRITDIYKTDVDPLAKVMRHEMKRRGVKKLKVVFSDEKPLTPLEEWTKRGGTEEETKEEKGELTAQENKEKLGNRRKATPGSTAFVPAVAGLILAGEVIKDLTGTNEEAGRK